VSILDFTARRAVLQQRFVDNSTLTTKRLLALETRTFEAGVLDCRQKEMLGLMASLVLRCEDCIMYHVIECRRQGLSYEELKELLDIALMVGGSITIPHIRRIHEYWHELEQAAGDL
jgi:AhpD family alkylhydroperoxidase